MDTYLAKKKQLIELVDEALARPMSIDESYELVKRLQDLLKTIDDDKLYEFGVTFRRWLDDIDIRLRDQPYANSTTRRLNDWLMQNR